MDSYTKSALEALRSIPELQAVPETQVQWLLENSEFQSLQEGECLFEPETPIDWLYFILDGKLDLFIYQEGNKKVLAHYQKGGILGFLPYSRIQKSFAYGEATTPTELLVFPKTKIQELIRHNPELTEELVQVMVSNASNFTSQAVQNEKMLALGKLSAGLTHELNNPITSIQRDNAELSKIFLSKNLSDLVITYTGLNLEDKSKLQQSIDNWKHSTRDPELKPSEIRKIENDWMEKLSDWGMKSPEEAAEVFTDFGLDSEEIKFWIKKMNPEVADSWLSWVQLLLQSQALAGNIQNATERIRRLIGAVKSYTHMDSAPVRMDLNLSEGIQDTLAILAHKLKASRVEVDFEKPKNAIFVYGFADELNQVWTNLIDNAIDALEGNPAPKVEIHLTEAKNSIFVEITDNGSGIPEEIKAKIFDPFFTTKGIGKGTGMGLELVKQIIHKHGGTIHVDSIPSQTTFKLEFPRN